MLLPQQRYSASETELFLVVVRAIDGVDVYVLFAYGTVKFTIPLSVEVMGFVYHFAPAIEDPEGVITLHDIVQGRHKQFILGNAVWREGIRKIDITLTDGSDIGRIEEGVCASV